MNKEQLNDLSWHNLSAISTLIQQIKKERTNEFLSIFYQKNLSSWNNFIEKYKEDLNSMPSTDSLKKNIDFHLDDIDFVKTFLQHMSHHKDFSEWRNIVLSNSTSLDENEHIRYHHDTNKEQLPFGLYYKGLINASHFIQLNHHFDESFLQFAQKEFSNYPQLVTLPLLLTIQPHVPNKYFHSLVKDTLRNYSQVTIWNHFKVLPDYEDIFTLEKKREFLFFNLPLTEKHSQDDFYTELFQDKTFIQKLFDYSFKNKSTQSLHFLLNHYEFDVKQFYQSIFINIDQTKDFCSSAPDFFNTMLPYLPLEKYTSGLLTSFSKLSMNSDYTKSNMISFFEMVTKNPEAFAVFKKKAHNYQNLNKTFCIYCQKMIFTYELSSQLEDKTPTVQPKL